MCGSALSRSWFWFVAECDPVLRVRGIVVDRHLAPEGGFIFLVGRGRFMAASGLHKNVHILPRELGQKVEKNGFFSHSVRSTPSPLRFLQITQVLRLKAFSCVRHHASCGQVVTPRAQDTRSQGVRCPCWVHFDVAHREKHRTLCQRDRLCWLRRLGSLTSPRRQRPQKICSSPPLVKV